MSRRRYCLAQPSTTVRREHRYVTRWGALTIGAVRDFPRLSGFEFGLGSAVTFHHVPERLVSTHGASPVSFIVFLRVRPPVSAMGRMWNMTMTRPMAELGRQRMGP